MSTNQLFSVQFNEAREIFEVYMNDFKLEDFANEADAQAFLSKMISVFEYGYTNGLLVGVESPEDARKLLAEREVEFEGDLEDFELGGQFAHLPIED